MNLSPAIRTLAFGAFISLCFLVYIFFYTEKKGTRLPERTDTTALDKADEDHRKAYKLRGDSFNELMKERSDLKFKLSLNKIVNSKKKDEIDKFTTDSARYHWNDSVMKSDGLR